MKENNGLSEDQILDGQLRDVPISDKTKAELKDLTPSVQQFLIRFMDVRDLTVEDKIVKKLEEVAKRDRECLLNELAEVLTPWNKRLENIEVSLKDVKEWKNSVNELVDRWDTRIENLETKVYKTDEDRLKDLEEYAHPKNTFIRMAIAGAVGIGIALLLFFMIINKKLGKMEQMMEDHVRIENTR